MNKRAFSWIVVAVLLIYLVARLTALSAFPPFVDESTHIDYGRTVLAQGPLARSEEGRQFLVWWYILFGAQSNASLWIARAVSIIALLPGLAALIGVAKLLSNRWAAIFTALFMLFSPYHHFFERLALADPISSSAVMCAVYFASRLKRRARYSDAAFCGFALFVAVGLKVSALPYFAIPVIAVLALRRSQSAIQWAAAALIVGLGLTGAFLGLLYWRGYNPLFHLESASSLSRFEVVFTNLGRTAQTLIGYFGLPITLLLVAAIVVLLLRRRLFLPLCLLLPLGVIWLNPSEDSRHLIAPMTLLLLGAAVALGDFVERYRQIQIPALVLVAVVGLLLWTPFAVTEATNPIALAIPFDDRNEYMASEGTGFGLAQVVAELQPLHPTRVIGILANCFSLHDLAPFPVECPRIDPGGADIQTLTTQLASSRSEGTYAVLETIPYAPASAPGTVVSAIDVQRPRLTIYNLAP
ncbi:MAG: hypothetical protein GC204_01295 [Chloroflexi bacterium]|nr:hypothetical protein [Chloroflexota bacterium]